MKVMKVKYFVISFFLLVSCSTKQDQNPDKRKGGVDYGFVSNYQNCVAIVSLYQSGSGLVNSEHFLKSLDCLKALTAVEPHVYLGDVVGYTSEEDFEKDMKAWSAWYGQNMKEFSIDDAYRKFDDFRKANEYEITWPPLLTDIVARDR